MEDSKFIKAKCRKTGRWYGLEIRKFGGEWKVVNMIDLPESEAKLISSEIKQAAFYTNDNLNPCTKCKSRKVGGCSCASSKHQCSKNMSYCFDCIYCKELEIDYSLPSSADVTGRVGGKVTLSQGQVVEIKSASGGSLSHIFVGVGWDPAKQGHNIDVDSSVLVMSSKGRGAELVYFGDREHPSGCVIHHGDNLTGENIPNADDENISIDLKKVPQDRDKLVFVLNIYECEHRGQTFGGIRNLFIRLYDPDSKTALIEYKALGNYARDTALIIGVAFRKNGAWYFEAVGTGSRATDLNELTEECLRKFG